MTAFDDALAALLEDEGGRVDNKKDPGGRTNLGVTQRTFDAWQKAHGLPRRDVWTITRAEAAAIYRNAYFDPVRFDDLPAGVGYCVADESANSGPHQAVSDLQRALGMTGKAVDGAVGVLTLAAAAKADPVVLIGKLCDVRLGFLRRLTTFVTFGKGWSNRVARVRARALKMAAVVPHPLTPTSVVDHGSAKVIDKAVPARSEGIGPAAMISAPRSDGSAVHSKPLSRVPSSQASRSVCRNAQFRKLRPAPAPTARARKPRDGRPGGW